MNLKKRGFVGLFWASAEQMGNKIIQFVIGIILARLLEPSEFGLIGMITIFISISEGIASGGFSQALIRKKDVKDEDYNTAFFYNFLASIILYAIFYLLSPHIASFYNEIRLEQLVKALMLVVIIDSFAFVQRAKLIKHIDFKSLAKASVISQLLGGIAGIVAAYYGLGVWSLVIKMILTRLIGTINLIIINLWIPKFQLSKNSFSELFGFGSRILLTQLIERIYRNIYLVIIGKFYSPAELGYYTRANMFRGLVSEQLTGTTQKVSLPLLSEIQDDEERLRKAFRRLVSIIFFVSSFLLIGLIPISKAMIQFLIGDKWLPSVPFLQILAIAGILYPVGEINLNVLQVKGRADYILKLQTIKKLISIPVIVLGVYLGLIYLVWGIVLISLIDFFLSTYYSRQLIGFSGIEQLQKALKYLFVFTGIAAATFLIGNSISHLYSGIILVVQALFYLLSSIMVFEVLRMEEYEEVKKIILSFFKTIKHKGAK